MLHLQYDTLSDFIKDCNPSNLADAAVPHLAGQNLTLVFENPHLEFLYKNSLDGFEYGLYFIGEQILPRLGHCCEELAYYGRISEPLSISNHKVNFEYRDGILILEGTSLFRTDLSDWAAFIQPMWTLVQIYFSELLGARGFVQKWNLSLSSKANLGDLSLAPSLFGDRTELPLGVAFWSDLLNSVGDHDRPFEPNTIGFGLSEIMWAIELYKVDNSGCLPGPEVWVEGDFYCPFPEGSHLFKWLHQCLLALPGSVDN